MRKIKYKRKHEPCFNKRFIYRRLEAQLKTIQLEEQLEKQRQRAEKVIPFFLFDKGICTAT